MVDRIRFHEDAKRIDVKGLGVEGWGRNGFFQVDHIEVYVDPDDHESPEIAIHVRSAKSRDGSPMLLRAPRKTMRKLLAVLKQAAATAPLPV